MSNRHSLLASVPGATSTSNVYVAWLAPGVSAIDARFGAAAWFPPELVVPATVLVTSSGLHRLPLPQADVLSDATAPVSTSARAIPDAGMALPWPNGLDV